MIVLRWAHSWRTMSVMLDEGQARFLPKYYGGALEPDGAREGPDALSSLFGVFVPDHCPTELIPIIAVLSWRRLMRMGWKAWADDWMTEAVPF